MHEIIIVRFSQFSTENELCLSKISKISMQTILFWKYKSILLLDIIALLESVPFMFSLYSGCKKLIILKLTVMNEEKQFPMQIFSWKEIMKYGY